MANSSEEWTRLVIAWAVRGGGDLREMNARVLHVSKAIAISITTPTTVMSAADQALRDRLKNTLKLMK